MPELPEIVSRANEMRQALTGKVISAIEVLQPKCLNVPTELFISSLQGARILDVCNHGKWIFVETTQGYLLLSLGMGGEILLTTRARLPEKHRLIFDFEDGTCLSVNFWWFGYAHYAPPGELASHTMTARLGPNANAVSAGQLKEMLKGQRGQLKAFLLDQSKIAGIGNAYIHDILFLARLHPQRKIDTLSEAEIEALSKVIHDSLQFSIDKGGAFYELNLFGEKGGFVVEDIIIGYREGTACPVCATPIEKLKTGSTSSFICPQCQPLVK